jgi:hypothetical protein
VPAPRARDNDAMKLQATIVISFQAASLADAGAKLDDVLERPREREDIDVESVELHTPTGSAPVSLPHLASTAARPAHVPHPLPNGGG